jgi:2-succinyl-5-enolpyruvyl-6-hydroxy-3-cyclohexene-1-carboxylate synthase
MSFDLKLINGDFSLKNGQLETAVDSEKLIQDILKICLTPAGANPIHPEYGSFISKTLIGSSLDPSIIIQVGKSQLSNCLENLKNLQSLQVKSFQRVTADEQISSVSNIIVQFSEIDPRLINVEIRVFSKGLKPLTVRFKINTI